jgi:hypothetical protein
MCDFKTFSEIFLFSKKEREKKKERKKTNKKKKEKKRNNVFTETRPTQFP